MIIVEAVLIPGGREDATRTRLCRMHIINDGTGTQTRRNYYVELYSKGKSPRIIKTARIENFPAKAVPAWRLIARAFEVISEK